MTSAGMRAFVDESSCVRTDTTQEYLIGRPSSPQEIATRSEKRYAIFVFQARSNLTGPMKVIAAAARSQRQSPIWVPCT